MRDNQVEFIYFEDGWNEEPTTIKGSTANTPRVDSSVEDANSGSE
jgi:hypothetical protein